MLLIGTFACAYATKVLGVHPVFGAFMFGAALPRDDRLLAALIERVEYIAIIVLMPIFFALAGLNTTSAVGSLMNARALMELIVMKVGLDAGVIGPDLFTMLMVMAILTTFMTGPLLTLFAGKDGIQEAGSADTVARP